MNDDNGKISVRQVLILCIIMYCSPIVRYLPLMCVGFAKQAAWLAPLIAGVVEALYMLAWCEFLKTYDKKSYIEVVKDILGKIIGNILAVIYFVWFVLVTAYNLRLYGERLIATTMPHVDILLILLSMLIVIGYVMKSGIVPFGRMNEVFFYILSALFIGYCILAIPEMKFKYLFPITYKDAVPVLKASIPVLTIFSYNIMIFMFNDKIDHRGEFKPVVMQKVIILTISSMLSIIVPLAIFSAPILVKMPLPFMYAMMQVSIFDIFERLEAGIIMFWIVTDFVLLFVFIYSALHMIRISFNLPNVRPLRVIYIMGIFLLSLILAKSTLELETLSRYILTYLNVILGFGVPIIVFFVGKIRKKI